MAVPYGENQYIYGLHDPGGEHLLKHGGQARGWVLVTEEIRANPNDQGGRGDFYKGLADQGFGVIVRLNHAYGSDGTIPLENKYPDFAQRAANFVRNSTGCHIWIVGNEMNFEREQPRLPGSSQAQPITPRRYAECYKLVRQAIKGVSGHEKDQILIGAIGPWNGQTPYEADPRGQYPANKIPGAPGDYPYHGFWGDFMLYFRDLMRAIGRRNCDGMAIHAYSHGYNPDLVFSDEKMGAPFQKYYYHFRTYLDQMNIIPAEFRDLPVYLTESNGDENPGGEKWPDKNSGWVKNAYKEINDWNQGDTHQQIRCVLLYRWSRDDDWHIAGKGEVHKDIQEAVAKGYTWNPDVRPARPEPKPKKPGYRTAFVKHNTPTTVTAKETLQVELTLKNEGGFTWSHDGARPFRLGFQWYDNNGQLVQLPSHQDFRTPLPRDIQPEEQVTLQAKLRTPPQPGTYQLRWDMVHEMVTWFTSQGDDGLLVRPVTVKPADKVEPPVAPQPVQIKNISSQLAQHDTKRYPQRTVDVIDRIIVHHTATPATITVQRIAEFLVKQRDLPGITYHYCITADGQASQTQPLTVVSAHAGQFSRESVGVCLVGNFSESSPPQVQLEAAASVLAQLAARLNLGLDKVVGYNELVTTGSPGATWSTWKPTLLAMAQELLKEPQPPAKPGKEKPVDHYMLFWHHGAGNWAEWDLRGAINYIGRFGPTVGFSVEEAKAARYVTIVGGPAGVPAEAEKTLRTAGAKVERLAGDSETETRQMLDKLAAEGRRFKTLKWEES